MASPENSPLAERTPSPGDSLPAAASGRLMSLDALRGFDMLWIMGGDSIGHAAAGVVAGPVSKAMADQLDHVSWEGFRFYDLIFPLFVFMAGVSLVFSLGKALEKHGRDAALVRLFRRSLVLYLVGIFYYGGLSTPLSDLRLLGVLQRIAIAYFMAGSLFLLFKTRTLVITAGAILLGYWAVLAWTPVRDVNLEKKALAEAMQSVGATNRQAFYRATTNYVRGSYAEGRNVVNHFDFQFLPLRKWDGNYDPEGVLSTIPAVVTCLLGVFVGLFFRDSKRTPTEQALRLAAAGVALVVAGHLWGVGFPVIKKLWTSSYVLVAGGWSCLLLAGFYYVIDVRQWRGWCSPLLWVGMNSIAVYLASNVVNFDQLATRLLGGNVKAGLDSLLPGLGGLLISVLGIVLVVWLARTLYRRNLFLRI
jgi:predicted acyltransferase